MIDKKFDELRLTGTLPSPSRVGLRILEITKDDDYDQEELTHTIMSDPALSGRIVKLANSALLDGASAVASVPQAAMRLGSRRVRTAAIGFTLISDNRSGMCDAFDYDLYWARSLAKAVASKAFALELGTFDASEAFTCALLGDLGMLALASVHPDRYSALLEGCPDADPLQLAELEEQAFDIDHYEVSSAMLADFGLPLAFQRAVLLYDREREHTTVDDEEARAIVVLLRVSRAVADTLVRKFDEQDEDWVQAFRNLERVPQELGIERSQFLRTCDEITPAWEEWSKVLGIPCEVAFSFVDVGVRLGELESEDAPPAPRELRIVDESRIQDAIATPSLETTISDEDEPEHPMRILLIDDDLRMLKLISHHLRREGYEVITAESSEHGLRKAFDLLPQIVITDWLMPGMTGVKLCETLRQSEAGRRMYVLIVTAREDDDQVVEAFAAGADDYIVKPFNPRILLARVRAGQRMIMMREQVEASERVRLRQVAELGILTRKLRAAAMTDALTELPNRRYAMKRLKQEWESSERTGRPLSVVMVDIDNFKRINDQYGHDVGDVVLREVAGVLRGESRSGDVLCRVGGEEFLSINAACPGIDAVTCAERLRVATEAHDIQHPGFDRHITLSLGVAERTEDMTCVDDLIKKADDALYEAKQQGRNCVFFEGQVVQADRKRSA